MIRPKAAKDCCKRCFAKYEDCSCDWEKILGTKENPPPVDPNFPFEVWSRHRGLCGAYAHEDEATELAFRRLAKGILGEGPDQNGDIVHGDALAKHHGKTFRERVKAAFELSAEDLARSGWRDFR